MPTAQLIAAERLLDGEEAGGLFRRALDDRARGRAVRACQTWARLEVAARHAGDRHLAVQAGAERALTLTWMGALSVAGVLCEQLLVELAELERDGVPLTPPPLDQTTINGFGGAWFSLPGLHRMRAEQLRRAGDYAGALEELEEASRSPDQRPHEALPLWGRVILSESLRLAGDFEGAHEVAIAAEEQADGAGAHPWVRVTANRAVARALLALDELDAALARFTALADDPVHRCADGGIACDLGIGEALRRRGDRTLAQRHLDRASAVALRDGHVVGWIQAQLCRAELARAGGADAGEVTAIVAEVQRRMALVEHPFLRLRTFAIGALSATGEQAERLVDRAEDELPRFHRRSCDLELERELVEVCRVAVAAGEEPPPIAMDFL